MRLVGVCVLALLAAVAVSADANVAAGATEVAANTAAAAVTETAAAATAQTEAKTEAKAETAVAAAANTEAAATAAVAAAASTETATAAAAEAVVEAEKPKGKKSKKAKSPKKTFKPVMINRHSRRAMRSQRHDVRYTDGGRAEVMHFGAPLRRRFGRWREAIKGQKNQYFTPRYDDQRYTSFVPRDAYFAPRRPTHFEPEYHDEHQVLEAFDRIAESPFAPFAPFAQFAGSGSAPFDYVIVDVEAPDAHPLGRHHHHHQREHKKPRTFEAEYEDEHAFLTGGHNAVAYDNAEVEYLPISGLPVLPNIPLEDLLSFERAIFPDSLERAFNPRDRPSSWALYGLPEFPEMPHSAKRHIARSAPFSGRDDPRATGRGDGSVLRVVEYPRGSGAEASLRKLDFALERLQTLNAELHTAEAKIAASRLRQAEAQEKLRRINGIRAKLTRMAEQIATLERNMGRNGAIQAEVARVVEADTIDGLPVLGTWSEI